MKWQYFQPSSGPDHIIINTEAIIKFYRLVIKNGYFRFKTILEERFIILDAMALNHRKFYLEKNQGNTLALMGLIANKLNTKIPSFDGEFQSYEEMLYFYIKVVDPNLKMLELYKSSINEEPEIVNKLRIYFGIFDKNLLRFEKHLNERVNLLESPDLAGTGRK